MVDQWRSAPWLRDKLLPLIAPLQLSLAIAPVAGMSLTAPAEAACVGSSCTVTTSADTLGSAQTSLRDAITYANAHTGTTITFSNTIANQTITVGSSGLKELPLILGNNTVIDGETSNVTVSGGSTSATTGYRVFFVGDAGQNGNGSTNATIENLTVANANARGGNGATAGGGGAGLGGGIFVSSTGALTLSGVTLQSNAATGGAAGGFRNRGGGGGGLGGDALSICCSGGGGGFGSAAAGGRPGGEDGSAGAFTGGGSGGHGEGSSFTFPPRPGGAGGANGGGGGGGDGGAGAGGGVGGANAIGDIGGAGGFGGGGGGGSPGGAGGFGGGGGGSYSNAGGNGGFGGGGGGGDVGYADGTGGFAAGSGHLGGGGAGLGGGIFVMQGGSLILGGTLSVNGNTVAGGTGANTAANGSPYGAGLFLQGNGTFTFQPLSGQAQTVTNSIADQTGSGGTGANAGSYALVKTGAGTLTLSGTNTYTGGTTFAAGTINAGSAGALGSTGTLSFTGGTLQYSGANQTDYSGRFSTAANQAYSIDTNGQAVTFASALTSQGGSLTKLGTGTLMLTGANTYSGSTSINAGALRGEAANAFSATSTTSIATGGTLDLGSFNQTIDTIAGTGRITNNGTAAATLTTGGTAVTSTFAGTITDGTAATALTKTGTGTLTLSGANSYSGDTTISGGTLKLDHVTNGTIDAAGTGTITVGNATLEISHTGTLANSHLTLSGSTSSTVAATAGTTVTLTSPLTTNTPRLIFGTTSDTGTIVLANTGAGVSSPLVLLEVAGGTLTSSNLALPYLTSAAATTQIDAGGTLDFNGQTGLFSAAAIIRNLQGGTATTGGILTNIAGATTEIQGGTFAGQIEGAASIAFTTGTTTLSGINTYTGATTISGTLALAATGSIAQSSGVALATGGTFDLSGLTNGGTSIVALGNTATGQTGTVTLGANTLTLTNASGTFGGTIVGSGGLILTGGTQTLSGTNAYTGATTITAGNLVGGAANSFSAASATSIATGGTLDLGGLAQTINAVALNGGTLRNGALTGAVSSTGGAIDTLGGSASLTTTAGTTIATGTNTYTGGTTITGGTLQIGNGGTTGAIAGAVTDNGTLAFARSDISTFGNRVSGTGAVRQIGSGTTILTATNTYTGGTTISAGLLELGSGGTTGSITGNVINNATLAFNRSNTYQFDGVISGTGAVRQIGTGTTILTASNIYTGATIINAGTLQVDGSIASPNVTVNAGGTLSGIGKIGDPQINAGGTLSPGNAANPTGTLTIVGPLGFAAGSFYNVNITPTANSRTNVTGVTTIAGGTVQVMASSGTYATNQRYTILTSTGGVAGTFTRATAATNFAFLTPTLSYGANDVYVTVLPMAPIVTTNPMTGAPTTVPNYRTAAGTQNQLAVASGLTQAGIQSGGAGRVLTALDQLSTPQARAAFDALSGEGLTASQNIANRSAELFTSSIFDQTTFYGSGNAANSIMLTEPIRELADLPARAATPVFVQPNRTWRAWATGFGGVDDIHGNGQIGSAYQQNTIYGGTLGVDYQLTPNYLVGVAIGGTNGDFLVPGRATSGSTTGGHVAFYDLATFGSFYGASSTSFSYFGNRATRTVSGFGGLGTEIERANFNSDEFRSRLEFGRHLAGYGGVLTPFVALELAQLRSNGFTENAVQGAGLFRLNVSGQSQASAPAFVGLRLQRVTSIGNGITISPTLQVAYVHEFAPYRSQIGTIADLPGSTFLVDGARQSRNAAQVKAGAEMAIGARSVIFANFDGEFSDVNQLYAGKGGFRWAW